MKAMLLAAGEGTRLRPYTENWPKCLMPIKKIPLLEYWLTILNRNGIEDILINTCYLSDVVNSFLDRPHFNQQISTVYEHKLLGTAATIRQNAEYFRNDTAFIAHADNWCCCDFENFFFYHHNERPSGTLMTMMTFETEQPQSCGIVQTSSQGVVTGFYEKVKNPPGNLANAAVYLVEPEVINWIANNENITDFSKDVLPHFLGKIATWKNTAIHRDIGTIEMLKRAQRDNCNLTIPAVDDQWYKTFLVHPIHKMIIQS